MHLNVSKTSILCFLLSAWLAVSPALGTIQRNKPETERSLRHSGQFERNSLAAPPLCFKPLLENFTAFLSLILQKSGQAVTAGGGVVMPMAMTGEHSSGSGDNNRSDKPLVVEDALDYIDAAIRIIEEQAREDIAFPRKLRDRLEELKRDWWILAGAQIQGTIDLMLEAIETHESELRAIKAHGFSLENLKATLIALHKFSEFLFITESANYPEGFEFYGNPAPTWETIEDAIIHLHKDGWLIPRIWSLFGLGTFVVSQQERKELLDFYFTFQNVLSASQLIVHSRAEFAQDLLTHLFTGRRWAHSLSAKDVALIAGFFNNRSIYPELLFLLLQGAPSRNDDNLPKDLFQLLFARLTPTAQSKFKNRLTEYFQLAVQLDFPSFQVHNLHTFPRRRLEEWTENLGSGKSDLAPESIFVPLKWQVGFRLGGLSQEEAVEWLSDNLPSAWHYEVRGVQFPNAATQNAVYTLDSSEDWGGGLTLLTREIQNSPDAIFEIRTTALPGTETPILVVQKNSAQFLESFQAKLRQAVHFDTLEKILLSLIQDEPHKPGIDDPTPHLQELAWYAREVIRNVQFFSVSNIQRFNIPELLYFFRVLIYIENQFRTILSEAFLPRSRHEPLFPVTYEMNVLRKCIGLALDVAGQSPPTPDDLPIGVAKIPRNQFSDVPISLAPLKLAWENYAKLDAFETQRGPKELAEEFNSLPDTSTAMEFVSPLSRVLVVIDRMVAFIRLRAALLNTNPHAVKTSREEAQRIKELARNLSIIWETLGSNPLNWELVLQVSTYQNISEPQHLQSSPWAGVLLFINLLKAFFWPETASFHFQTPAEIHRASTTTPRSQRSAA